jgi:hypothetical protein
MRQARCWCSRARRDGAPRRASFQRNSSPPAIGRPPIVVSGMPRSHLLGSPAHLRSWLACAPLEKMHLLGLPAHLLSWLACAPLKKMHLLGSCAHLLGWLARAPLKKMHLLGSCAHLPVACDRACHEPACFSDAPGHQNVTDAHVPGSVAPSSSLFARFSTGDAHLPSSKMREKGRALPFFEKGDRPREEIALRRRIAKGETPKRAAPRTGTWALSRKAALRA